MSKFFTYEISRFSNNPEMVYVKQTQMYVEGFKAKPEKDMSYKGLWTVNFTFKEF